MTDKDTQEDFAPEEKAMTYIDAIKGNLVFFITLPLGLTLFVSYYLKSLFNNIIEDHGIQVYMGISFIIAFFISLVIFYLIILLPLKLSNNKSKKRTADRL